MEWLSTLCSGILSASLSTDWVLEPRDTDDGVHHSSVVAETPFFIVVQESTGCHNARFLLYVQMSGWAKDITQVVKGCPRVAGLGPLTPSFTCTAGSLIQVSRRVDNKDHGSVVTYSVIQSKSQTKNVNLNQSDFKPRIGLYCGCQGGGDWLLGLH